MADPTMELVIAWTSEGGSSGSQMFTVPYAEGPVTTRVRLTVAGGGFGIADAAGRFEFGVDEGDPAPIDSEHITSGVTLTHESPPSRDRLQAFGETDYSWIEYVSAQEAVEFTDVDVLYWQLGSDPTAWISVIHELPGFQVMSVGGFAVRALSTDEWEYLEDPPGPVAPPVEDGLWGAGVAHLTLTVTRRIVGEPEPGPDHHPIVPLTMPVVDRLDQETVARLTSWCDGAEAIVYADASRYW